MRTLIYLAFFFFTGIIILRVYWEHREKADKDKEDTHDDQENTNEQD